MPSAIDVVVPVYNNYSLTERCLRHLAAQTAAHHVIVVDDGSSDGTPERLRREWPAVQLLELGANRGYTAAVNRGVAAGSGAYVVLLNNDVELAPDCLERLVAPMRDDLGLGSVAAVILAPDGSIDSVGVTVDCTLAGFQRLHGRPAAEAASPAPLLVGPEGTCGAYRRAAWEQVEGLDEEITAYMEVLDLALRLCGAGWRTALAPEARGVHLGSGSYGARSAAQRRLAGYSRGYLLRRYGMLRGRAAARTLATEAVVVAADIALCRDAAALAGRVAGWRRGGRLPRRPAPPADAIDGSITLWGSLLLRRRTV
jgi:GT2 family glycosyltransferase